MSWVHFWAWRKGTEGITVLRPRSFRACSPEKQLSCFGDLQAEEPARQGSDHTKLFSLVTSSLSVWFPYKNYLRVLFTLVFLGKFLVMWIIWQEKILTETVVFFWNWLEKLHIFPSTHSLSLKIKLRPLKMALGSANFPKCRLLGFPFLPVRWWVKKDTTRLFPNHPQ